MNTEEVAKKVVELTRKQAWYDALDLYDDNVVSMEASGMGGGSPETRGKEGVRGKVDWWVNSMDVHSFDVQGTVRRARSFCCALQRRRLGQENQTASQNVRSRRLHGQGRQDRSRRVFAARGLIHGCEGQIDFDTRPPLLESR